MPESRFPSPVTASIVADAPRSQSLRQSLGLIDRPCTESELLQHLIEGTAARQELDRQAGQLLSLAEHSAAAEAKNGFLHNLGQEMRTPLNGIMGMTEELRSKHLPESASDCVEAIRKSGDALLAIVDDMLHFSNIESGRLRIEHADFEIAPLLAQSVQIMGTAASRKFLTIQTCVDPALPPVVSGDALRVRQILLNLLGNAIKFSFAGEIELRAELRAATRKGLEIYFSVKDGLEATARPSGVSGLGLTVCKRLAELMGGDIGVTSIQGSGSLFWFTILAGRSKQNPVALEHTHSR
jgi:two-component system, sensor histidine kinase and response regulator